jgi:hypothetical protein
MLSLDINLFCEQTFDGAKVQISLNGGLSWQDVGSYSSSTYQVFPNALNCREQNWYNKNNINYLNGTSGGCGAVSFSLGGTNSGWSGGCAQAASGACISNDIHGTNGWVTATHCIPQAANQTSFKLRIGFGSGSQVYSDGIAFDNVKILDVYPVVNHHRLRTILELEFRSSEHAGQYQYGSKSGTRISCCRKLYCHTYSNRFLWRNSIVQ